ncbi:MAG: right-handed parallel beta-helix repeat-containing protein [Marinilabiliaceae bacterium]|nr:right-handed parallel beta-helix repeat-containing protein [Marinilabiliaceae bacterium]
MKVLRKMKECICIFLVFFCLLSCTQTKEYHVSKSGNDSHAGSEKSPFLTIQQAANMAQPGDVIIVHEGVYREEITPPRGGASNEERIVYRAAEGEKVVIKGSEIITGWKKESENVWTVEVPNTLFGEFNPFAEIIVGDWFDNKGRKHHTGCVYQDGEWLFEAAEKADLNVLDRKAWFVEVSYGKTTVYATFGDTDPNNSLTEINVRQTVFYPRKPFINYITVKGFTLTQAAPAWAPPTAEQMGLIGTHWSKGWIIEDNTISHSINVGLSMGKYGDQYDNATTLTSETKELDLRFKGGGWAYLHTIDRARETMKWNKANIGSHIVRNNKIFNCEQAGIVGSMGAAFSQITNNHIHDIHTQRRFGGAEMAAIKFHAPIDMLIANNRINDAWLGIWLDWMTQGTRVTGNLLYRNDCHDIYAEVNHGPYIVDNNICLSNNCRHLSQGGAFVHNLFDCEFGTWEDGRSTPYFKAHSTEKVDDHKIDVGDDRFYNNMWIGNGGKSVKKIAEKNQHVPFYYSYGTRCYEFRPQLPEAGGNTYYHGAEPCDNESTAKVVKHNPNLAVMEEGDEVYLILDIASVHEATATQVVTTDLLGKAVVPDVLFYNYDGTDLIIDSDYFGKKRDSTPTPGPFENIKSGKQKVKVWPKK